MVFRSRQDGWVVALLIASVALGSVAVIPAVATGNLTVSVVISIASVALVIWLLMATYYRVDDGELTIVSGPLSWRIDLTSIESIEPSRSVLAAPALSLDRLEIRYGGGRSVLVSPDDQAAFIAAIRVRG
ncbi:MAG: PH domain-containing protein [Pseudomonadota bacterium]